MKKLLFTLFAAASLTACNNAGDGKNVEDSVLKTIDSVGEARKDSVEEATDSTKERLKETFDKTDSANRANSDTSKNF
jgi:hypothetical protein